MLLISVIVPIYNVENFLDKCILSILNQKYKNIELILVNDGSTDNCPIICDQYALIDNRVKVIHKENGGLPSAITAGLEISSGEYIGFVDGDDYIDTDMYEKMAKIAQSKNVDIVQCAFVCETSNGEITKYINIDEGSYSFTQISNILIPALFRMNKKNKIIYPSRCNKLFVREVLIDNMKYTDHDVVFGEDFIRLLPALIDSKRIECISNHYYHYIVNPSSITRTYNKNMSTSNQALIVTIKDIILSKKVNIDNKFLCEYFRGLYRYEIQNVLMSSLSKREKKSIIDLSTNIYKKNTDVFTLGICKRFNIDFILFVLLRFKFTSLVILIYNFKIKLSYFRKGSKQIKKEKNNDVTPER